jgi:membrane-bound serine protease (ClpP class)
MILGLGMNQFLPRMPFYNLLVLSPPEAMVPEMSGASFRTVIAGDDRLVGRRGKTLTVLRPSGKLDLDGDVLDVLSDSGYIAAGEQVEVISAKGNRIVVRQMS